MGISRKDALKRLGGLVPRVVEHFSYITKEPNSLTVPHWRHEISNWLAQMEEVLHALGKKTAAEWRKRIDGWRSQLPE